MFSAHMNFVEHAQCDSAKLLGIHLLQDRYRADQVMRRFCQSRGIGFCGQKIETAINLKCVGADDFRIEIVRDVGREFRLSGGGQADNEKNVFHSMPGRAESRHLLLLILSDSSTPLGMTEGGRVDDEKIPHIIKKQNPETRASKRYVSRLKSPILTNF